MHAIFLIAIIWSLGRDVTDIDARVRVKHLCHTDLHKRLRAEVSLMGRPHHERGDTTTESILRT